MSVLLDTNVLIEAFRVRAPSHSACKAWLETALDGRETVLLADVVLFGFVRIVTNPRAFTEPSPPSEAVEFVRALRQHPNAAFIVATEERWLEFERLMQLPGIRGNLVTDAYIAALAMGSDASLATMDGDFARFPGLRVIDPRTP